MERKKIFRFKRFSVSHWRSAMKVGVDGVLVGAWANVPTGGKVLDVGCGCGVIALMCAQRGCGGVLGIDVHAPSVEEARENVRASRWQDIVEISQTSFDDVGGQWDLVVSNPPYFDAGVNTHGAPGRVVARHAGELSPLRLLDRAPELLTDAGVLAMICPCSWEGVLAARARDEGLYLKRLTLVSNKPGALPKRMLAEWSKKTGICGSGDIMYLRDEEGGYSQRYRHLTEDFYLDF